MQFIPETIEDAKLVLQTRVTDRDLDYLAPDVKAAILIIRDDIINTSNAKALSKTNDKASITTS